MDVLDNEDRLAHLEQKRRDLAARIRQLSRENRDLGFLVRSLLEANPFAVVMFDAQRRLIGVNRAAEILLGQNRTTLVGRSCDRIFACYEQNDACPVLDRQQKIYQQDVSCSADLARQPILMRSCSLVTENEEPVLIESFIDVSDIRHAQQEKDRILRTKENFLALVSHELRTPLNAILGANELMLDEPMVEQDPDLKKLTETSVHATRHLIKIVNTIIDYSKLVSGKLVLEPEDINIRSMFADLIELSQASALRHNNTLSWDCDDDVDIVHADEHRLQHVIFQALENANEFTCDGKVHLQARYREDEGGRWLTIEISDTGSGISADALERVFNLFEQEELDYSTHGTGFGLGLCVARNMVQAMGGDIECASELGKGTTLTLLLSA